MDYSNIPVHMVSGIKNYIEAGHPVGGFLYAVITNDLTEAFARADDINVLYMREWVMFLYNQMPFGSWRTKENYETWIKHHGLLGSPQEKTGT